MKSLMALIISTLVTGTVAHAQDFVINDCRDNLSQLKDLVNHSPVYSKVFRADYLDGFVGVWTNGGWTEPVEINWNTPFIFTDTKTKKQAAFWICPRVIEGKKPHRSFVIVNKNTRAQVGVLIRTAATKFVVTQTEYGTFNFDRDNTAVAKRR